MRLQLPAIVAFFDDPHALLTTARRARVHTFKNMEAYTPFPVHGINEALSIKWSWISAVCKGGLLTGAILGFLFQVWTSAFSWPLNIGGKPFISWPAFIPVTFECGVLVGGFLLVVMLLYATNKFPGKHPRILSEAITNNQFALVIPIGEDNNNEGKVREFLMRMNAKDIKRIDA